MRRMPRAGRSCSICATAARCCAGRPKCSPASRRGAACRNGARTSTATVPTGPTRRRIRRSRCARSCCSPTPSTAISSAKISTPRCACWSPAAIACTRRCRRMATRGRCAAAAPFSRSGRSIEARREMERTLEALAPYVARGVPVIGLEPSCLFTFRDELPALIKSEAANALAAQALLLEEFLAREQKGRPAQSAARPAAEKGAAARPLPPEGVRRHGRGRERAQADPGA